MDIFFYCTLNSTSLLLQLGLLISDKKKNYSPGSKSQTLEHRRAFFLLFVFVGGGGVI